MLVTKQDGNPLIWTLNQRSHTGFEFHEGEQIIKKN